MQYIPIIGMEIHVEPTSNSKMFCECPADHFAQPANTHTCPVCLGLPGALPIPNQSAINACVKLGLALNCHINQQSKFDRKNYFYPDLPKAYQISQYDLPFCENGHFEFPSTDNPDTATDIIMDSIGITRIHMEEDTGKLQHQTLDGQSVSLIDYNRSGVPLIEIVTEPHLHSAAQVKQFLKWLTKTLRYLDISNCDMEKGTMRLEANISVAALPPDKGGSKRSQIDYSNIPLPNYKVEVKNVNSFRYIEKAIEYEINRHIELSQSGQTPAQETRGYNENRGVTFSQRTKEEAQDYRYFPEPDIPPINLDDSLIKTLTEASSHTPVSSLTELNQQHQLRLDYLESIITSPNSISTFNQIIADLPNGLTVKDAAKLITQQKIDLQATSTKELFATLKKSIKTYSLSRQDIQTIIDELINNSPEQIQQFKDGKTNIIGYFVGQVMQRTKGQADPKLVNQLLTQTLQTRA